MNSLDGDSMRIVLVSQAYPGAPPHGGIATQTEAKARGLAKLGHDVTVIAHSVTGARSEASRDGVNEIRIPSMGDLEVRTEVARWVAWSSCVAVELQRLDRAKPIDVVDFPEYGAEAYLHLLNRASWRSIPTTVHLQGPLIMLAHTIGWPELDSELYKTGTVMESACIRLADAIASSSRRSIDWVSRTYGIAEMEIPVIHMGVDADAFRPGLRPRDATPTIVFVGRVAQSKGCDVLVDAACAVAAHIPGLVVRLIGSCEDRFRAELQAHAAAAGLPRLLEFSGPTPHHELPDALCRAHVFAAPSRYEGGPGFVYLEAMACGLPTIGCSGSGVEEVIRDRDTGLLVPPGDAPALAQALLDVLRDASFADALAHRARQYIEQHCRTDECVARYERFLRSAIASVS